MIPSSISKKEVIVQRLLDCNNYLVEIVNLSFDSKENYFAGRRQEKSTVNYVTY